MWQAWSSTLRVLRPLAPVTEGNRIEVLADGDEVFERSWRAIAQAQTRVLMNTYVLAPDRVGERTLRELVGAVRRGCEVVLIFDAFGSRHLDSDSLAALRDLGAEVVAYNPMLRSSRFGRIQGLSRLVRNHRKILVIDDHLAFAGGMNVAEDYAGRRFGSNLFRDTQLQLTGPCVHHLARLIEATLFELSLRRPPKREQPEPLEGGALVQVLESNVRRERRAIQRALRTTLARSVERCYLTTPYFVPPGRLIRTLVAAAGRGVDVRVLTAGRSDVPLVRHASRHLYGVLLRAGVRIFELQESMLHAKTATIDGVYAMVGSFNLDFWSYRRNLEVGVAVLDRHTAGQIEEHFLGDLASSREVELSRWEERTWWQRLVGWLAYVVLRV